MEDIKIRDCPANHLEDAVDCAKHFMENYPERKGVYNGVAYSKKGHPSFYVYNTKKMVVVWAHKS